MRDRILGIRCGDWQIPAGALPLPSSGEDPGATTTTSIDEGPATTEPPETATQASRGCIGEDSVTLSSYLCATSSSYGCCKDGYECGILSCTLRGGPDFTSQPDRTARTTVLRQKSPVTTTKISLYASHTTSTTSIITITIITTGL
ncbi:hypothetical protein H072_10140 [Dactylellina haptotyla CBS 200.50]|uniref:Uncharacterized protein n=1 Tax=Dactylellina haptotyla (strain CBS 200.50) TaxID=1284197 RepID=S8A5I8_DACHA|nr:hypothetical protein H072_10140 [Dactylellina haptotyla CBS 200.50]